MYIFLQKIESSEVLKCLIHGARTGKPSLTKYSSEVRKFCFALNYHSPAAYRIVRDYFEKRLPHPKTLVSWLKESDVNGEHGIRDETMKRLTGFVKDLKDTSGEQLICTVILDEMYIKKELYWDFNKFEYGGYPTYENRSVKSGSEVNALERAGENSSENCKSDQSIDQNEPNKLDDIDELNEYGEFGTTTGKRKKRENKKEKCPLATRALVFMLSGINKSLEFPIGYHFMNGLGGESLADLVKEVIMKVSEYFSFSLC